MDIEDINLIINYFKNSTEEHLKSMGVDPDKLPEKSKWFGTIKNEFALPVEKKSLFYLIWSLDNKDIGHCNLNKIQYGKEAYMHLHIWNAEKRKKGVGLELLKRAIPHFFEIFSLKKIFCEPYSLNPAPNKTLEKLGFEFIKQYETTPGLINFPQTVNRWCLTKERSKLALQ